MPRLQDPSEISMLDGIKMPSNIATTTPRRSPQSNNHQQQHLQQQQQHQWQPLDDRRRKLQQRRRNVALSKTESILISSAGDVLLCRCRDSTQWNGLGPGAAASGGALYQWHEDIALLCCDNECDNISTQIQTTALCSPWNAAAAVTATSSNKHNTTPPSNSTLTRRSTSTTTATPKRGGLLGGAPADVAAPLHHHHDRSRNPRYDNHHSSSHPHSHHGHPEDRVRGGGGPYVEQRMPSSSDSSFSYRAQRAFRSQPLPAETDLDEESLVPIRSFDYSHFHDGGNDMIPPTPRSQSYPTTDIPIEPPLSDPTHMQSPHTCHGIPTFWPAFCQVKITQVSAHPLGSHVLLISNAGLLYSYGLNIYGQLGIGLKTHLRGQNRGYIMVPTIVTPLVEHGGKSISCAAGISHSLVVVVTEERRLVRSQSMENVYSARKSYHESIVHHQMYGFGRNDFMKIGLVSPKLSKPGSVDEMEHVVLPRRVALRCKVRPEGSFPEGSLMPPQGIFAIGASAEHSAALVHRGSGDVELYTWGNASFGALGIPQPSSTTISGVSGQTSAVPIVRVVPVPSFVASLSRTSNPAALPASMLLRSKDEYPATLSLGRRCSFVTTSLGRCFSFGESQDGMLGLGPGVTESQRPSEIALPDQSELILSVSAGAAHVVALTTSQRAYVWGSCHDAGLKIERSSVVGPTNNHHSSNSNGIKVSSNAFHDSSQTAMESTSSSQNHNHIAASPLIQWTPRPLAMDIGSSRLVEISAGIDCSFFITQDGHVLSCGKHSGRLGLGERSQDVSEPTALFGGLRLWHKKNKGKNSTAVLSPPAPSTSSPSPQNTTK